MPAACRHVKDDDSEVVFLSTANGTARKRPCSHNVPVLLPPSVLHAVGVNSGVFFCLSQQASRFLFNWLIVNARQHI
ncbi:hypothetical protein KCP70_07595 [Salmonella enterica subsp. enterica]|nr:hypothetical protein KCP70_07595 [Salmonella enterica subsp. enterica]